LLTKVFSSLLQHIMTGIAQNLQAIGERLKAARGVTLLAVSKGQSVERIREAAAAGQNAFGENYVQEALAKMRALEEMGLAGLEWHLIGPLQSNKTRPAAESFAWVQTITSEKIARRLSEQRPEGLPPLNVLLQVNVSGEATKSGIAPAAVEDLAGKIRAMPRLRLRGLMAIPEPGAPRGRYREVKMLFEGMKAQFGFDTLSMGMSDDMELAIAEGATMVRIGTAIFGARQKARASA
jgi:pyridoxal phosphate enzyme (YggS family)